MSSVLILLTLPVMVATAIGSAIAFRAWPFFTQTRVGLDGEDFHFVKIRTLPPDFNAYASKHELEDLQIPAFGRLMRMLHLDELPQLFLVLGGRMSLIGPRPEMACLHEQMPDDFAALRTSVRPGCTGLWQVSDARTGLIVAAPEYDRFYLEHRSLRLDLWILVRTALQMTRIRHSLTLDDVPPWATATEGYAPETDLRVPEAELVGAGR